MKYEKLSEKAKKSWRIGRAIVLIVFLLILGGMVALSLITNFSVAAKWAVLGGVGLICAYLLIAFIVYPNLEYRQWKYGVTEDRVEIVHGIFFIKRSIIPIVRIQDITVSQGPINRKLGLYNIEISIASGSFKIPCLSKEVSEEISTNLKDRIYTRLAAGGVK